MDVFYFSNEISQVSVAAGIIWMSYQESEKLSASNDVAASFNG